MRDVLVDREACRAARDITGRLPGIGETRVRPALVRQFLEKYGPLTDSFMLQRAKGLDEHSDRALATLSDDELNTVRDPRGARWAYEFTEPAQIVARSFDLSRDHRQEACVIAWLLLDEAPQFSLLTVIALQAFSSLLRGKDMTACVVCGRYFKHKRVDQRGCTHSCANTLRVRRHRDKNRHGR